MKMGNDCCCRPNFNFTVKEIHTKDKEIVFVMCETCDLCDGQPFNFRLCDCLKETACREIYLKVGDVVFPLFDKIGDKVYANQIKARKIYQGVYGNDDPHVLCFNICKF